MNARCAAAVVASLALLPSLADAQVIGGFDASRGGIFSLASGSERAVLRAEVLSEYPQAQFTESSVLDGNYLDTLDVLVVGSAFSQSSGITPLTASEQSALSLFVQGGGAAVVLTDNDTFADVVTANASLGSVFGVTTTGTLSGDQTASVVVQNHPVTHGPFGSVTSYQTPFPGWFASEGSALVLARLDNAPGNAASALWLGPGDFLQGTGCALLLSDHVFPSAFVLNLIAFKQAQQSAAVPLLPSGAWAGLALGLLLGCVWISRSSRAPGR